MQKKFDSYVPSKRAKISRDEGSLVDDLDARIDKLREEEAAAKRARKEQKKAAKAAERASVEEFEDEELAAFGLPVGFGSKK